jgi:hypothetical protein
VGTEQSTAAGKAARSRAPQRTVNPAGDPGGDATDYYVRQLRDWKYSAPIERMGPSQLSDYGELCAWTLARAHARTGV